jgi:hypothetical protein
VLFDPPTPEASAAARLSAAFAFARVALTSSSSTKPDSSREGENGEPLPSLFG